MQRQADVAEHAWNTHVLGAQRDRLLRRCGKVAAEIAFAQLTPDHQTLQIVLRNVLRLHRIDIFAVTQNGDAVRFLQNLLQVV